MAEEDTTIMSETEYYLDKIGALEAAKSAETVVEAEVNIVVDEYKEPAPPVQLVVKAGEILENGDAAADEDDDEEIPTPEGATVYVVEAGELITGGENKEEEEEYTYEIGGGACSVDPPQQEEVYDYSSREDAASSGDVSSKSQEQYYRDNGYPERIDADQTVSSSVEDATDIKRKLVEELSTSLKENRIGDQENRIASLHEVVEESEKSVPVPVPAPRKAEPVKEDRTAAVVNEVARTASAIKVQSYASRNEDEDSFENLVKQNISAYRAEKSKTNAQVLASIEAEEGEDRPQANKLLAWAKSTRKQKTETMVVRQKKHDDKIRQAVDFGGVNLVFSEKNAKAPVPAAAVADKKVSPFKKSAKAKVDSGAVTTEKIRNILSSVLPGVAFNADTCSIKEHAQGSHTVTFSADKVYCWLVVNNEIQNKDLSIRRDLAKKMNGYSGSAKLPFTPLLYSDKHLSVFDEDPSYKPHPKDRPLDETHLKVGMKALARLHAITYVYLARGGDSQAMKLLTKTKFSDPNARSETKAGLEANLDAILSVLSKAGSGSVEQVKTLKNQLVNIYKEAETPANSLLPVLCHGLPTLQNVLFQYGPDNMPRDARFINLETAVYSSAVTDLHLFINTSGENTAREDFLLRFVYFETLVTCLKAAGEKVVFNYDDLKTEFTKKRLHGYIKSAAILAEKETGGKKATPAPAIKTSSAGPKVVDSKILGKFIPKAKVAAVNSFSKTSKPLAGDQMDNAAKIQEMMMKAIKL